MFLDCEKFQRWADIFCLNVFIFLKVHFHQNKYIYLNYGGGGGHQKEESENVFLVLDWI